MSFEEAVRIVDAAVNRLWELKGEDYMRINEATAILAKEYLLVRDRIMPA